MVAVLIWNCYGLIWAVIALGEPSLHASLSAIDFGDVRPHSQLTRTLELQNRGDRELDLTALGSDCVCLSSHLGAATLEPGGSGGWFVGLETCDDLGEVRRSVWVRADCGQRLQVPVRYRVVPETFAEPSWLSFGLFAADVSEPISAELDVMSVVDQDFELVGAECDDPRIEVLIEHGSVSAGKPGRVRAVLQQSIEPGPIRPTIWVMTTSDEVPKLRIPVFGLATNTATSNAGCVNLVAWQQGQSARGSLLVSHGEASVISRVELRCDGVRVAAVKQTERGTQILLESEPKTELGIIDGRLMFRMAEQGRQSHAVIPVTGRVLEGVQRDVAVEDPKPRPDAR